MNTETLRHMVREVLADELRRIKAERGGKSKTAQAPIREEIVSLLSDADLVDFVRRLLRMTADPRTRDELEAGRIRFKLGDRVQHQRPEVPPVALPHKGFLSERQIDDLPAETRVLTVGKSVRFTPLARDRLRARKITIERTG